MNRSKTASSHFDWRSSRLRYSSQRSSSQRQPSADSSSSLTSSPGSSAQSGCLSTLTSSGPATYSSLRPPDPGTGRVAGRTSYLLAETGFERSLSERARSLSEKQVKADKDLRRSAEERFFVFRGFRTFCLTAKSVS